MLVRKEGRMVTSIRIEAVGDTPDGVKRYFEEVERRLALGKPQIADEVYERVESGGYKGRLKLLYEVPLNATQDREWFEGKDPYADTDVMERLLEPEPWPSEEAVTQVREPDTTSD
jgi:hypothetical protein